ncbi:phosphoribosylanthranilate isomerase [Robiginitalea sp. IMCC43444]|uniref:phosphoribosylanthranilate isomerase n=1 Tax=Robiginitalea sp. IMCC43444 TaxID=3459121 RepID=UPI004041BD10
MKIKVCGMKYNPEAVAALGPDYLGFIFWDKSPRNLKHPLPGKLGGLIPRIGVFVDAPKEYIRAKMEEHQLDGVQLHGAESPAYCRELLEELNECNAGKVLLIKAFSVGDTFDFGNVEPYLSLCDYFLFDTKGKLPGGTGRAFNWELLKSYPFDKPFFLSGGIGPGDIPKIREFLKTESAVFCHAVDLNSKFEIQAGEKDVQTLKKFIEEIRPLAPQLKQ